MKNDNESIPEKKTIDKLYATGAIDREEYDDYVNEFFSSYCDAVEENVKKTDRVNDEIFFSSALFQDDESENSIIL